MDSKPTYSAPALDKGLDILEILAKTVMPMTMSEISDKAGRSRGEIFRMLQVLELRSYISRNGAGDGYVLTNKLFILGIWSWHQRNTSLSSLASMHPEIWALWFAWVTVVHWSTLLRAWSCWLFSRTTCVNAGWTWQRPAASNLGARVC